MPFSFAVLGYIPKQTYYKYQALDGAA